MKTKRKLEGSIYQMEQLYIMLYAISKKRLNDASIDKEELMVPTRKLVYSAEIGLYMRHLSTIDNNFANERIGSLDNIDGEWKIYMSIDSGSFTQRYATAYEFANYILIKMHEEIKNTSCSSILFPVDGYGMACDILASFLLLPFCSIVKLMERFIKEHTSVAEQGSLDEWIGYMRNQTGLTEYHATIGYQNIRSLAGALRNYANDADFKEETDNLIDGLGVNFDDEVALIKRNHNLFI